MRMDMNPPLYHSGKIIAEEPIAKLMNGDCLCHSSTRSFAIGSEDKNYG